MTPRRPGGGRASCAGRRRRSSSPSTRPTTRSASSKAPSSTRSAGRRPTRSRPSHGRGTGDLLDAIVWALPPESERELARKAREAEAEAWADEVAAGRLEPFVVGDAEADDDDGEDADDADLPASTPRPPAGMPRSPPRPTSEPAAIAFVGRPNVGKSSLLNALLGEDRAIVSEVPGTTRDAIDTRLAWGRSEIVLIDTAGIRRRGKVASGPAAERYSTLRALHALSRADVAVLVIDAVEGLTAQDAHVAGYVVEEGKGLVIAVNKWDLVEPRRPTGRSTSTSSGSATRSRSSTSPRSSRSAPRPASASGGCSRPRSTSGASAASAISTGELNRVLHRPPPSGRRRRRSAAAGRSSSTRPRPPSRRRRSCSSPRTRRSVHFSYRRYLENRLRETFGFDGTPIRLVFRDRTSVKLPRRKKARAHRVERGQGAAPRASAGQARRSALMAGPRVAVVGAGAWGTTLAALVARDGAGHAPVPLPGDGGTDRRDRAGTSARLPGIDLPRDRHRDRRPGGARATRPTSSSSRAVARTCGRRSARSRRTSPPTADLAVGRQGPRSAARCCG